jgi:hypothetical protein
MPESGGRLDGKIGNFSISGFAIQTLVAAVISSRVVKETMYGWVIVKLFPVENLNNAKRSG